VATCLGRGGGVEVGPDRFGVFGCTRPLARMSRLGQDAAKAPVEGAAETRPPGPRSEGVAARRRSWAWPGRSWRRSAGRPGRPCPRSAGVVCSGLGVVLALGRDLAGQQQHGGQEQQGARGITGSTSSATRRIGLPASIPLAQIISKRLRALGAAEKRRSSSARLRALSGRSRAVLFSFRRSRRGLGDHDDVVLGQQPGQGAWVGVRPWRPANSAS